MRYIRINEIKKDLNSVKTLKQLISAQIKVDESQILDTKLIRESIDARDTVIFKLTVDVLFKNPDKVIKKGYSYAPLPFIPLHEDSKTLHKIENFIKRNQIPTTAIIGLGPAGLFNALSLAYLGFKPIVIEQGEKVEERQKTVAGFWEGESLNTFSNTVFGEGGAGTFSDGKLTTRVKDPRIEFILSELVKAGAPEDITYKQHPHVGTDLLTGVVRNIREKIINLGGEIHFEITLVDFEKDGDGYTLSLQNVKTMEITQLKVDNLVLSSGHSGRYIYELLHRKQVRLESKPFAVGVRAEHPQSLININQYKDFFTHEKLGAAEYKLTYTTSEGRSVYSFCMCPGGVVVASSSEEGGVLVNGMSYHARDGSNANSAILVGISPEDFYNPQNPSVLDGINFQRDLENRAYQVSNSYFAPAQRLGDFLRECREDFGTSSLDGELSDSYKEQIDKHFKGFTHTYRPGVHFCSMRDVLPAFVRKAIGEAFADFGKKIKGFDHEDVVLTAVESRSSAPVRILRDKDSFESVSHSGIFPCGEGAGYAGGITSSAIDGVKVAEAIIRKYI